MANAPATTRVVKYIYLPNDTESGNARLGFRYDYSVYGMIFQTAKLHGMNVTSTALDQTGSVSSDGTQAALTTYSYPMIVCASLTPVCVDTCCTPVVGLGARLVCGLWRSPSLHLWFRSTERHYDRDCPGQHSQETRYDRCCRTMELWLREQDHHSPGSRWSNPLANGAGVGVGCQCAKSAAPPVYR